MTSFKIRPATNADAPAIARAHDNALSHLNDLYAAFFAMPIREALLAATEAGIKKDTVWVAEHVGTGAVAGFLRHVIIPAAEPGSQQEDKGTESQEQAAPSPWARKKHLEEVWQDLNARWDEMEACEKAAVKGQRYAYIKHLMVDPQFQRRGVGTLLLNELFSKTDAEGIPCFIVSSAESQGLYAKLGFQELGQWVIDDEHWARQIVQRERDLGITGNEGLVEQFAGVHEVEKCMLRKPGA